MRMVRVKGEISEIKLYPSGHAYFILKDQTSRLNCVIFNYRGVFIDYLPKDGDLVLTSGKISFYEQEGKLNFIIDKIEVEGIGEALRKFQITKSNLESLGYFDQENKKCIPKYPSKICLISSNNSAAYHDFITSLGNLPINIYLLDTTVHGINADKSIISSLNIAKSLDVDLIVVTRGGGSYEDLIVFNSEEIARIAFEIEIPLISAIGHEIDFTILDLVADKRAMTPTHAGFIIKNEYFSLHNKIYNDFKLLQNFSRDKIQENIINNNKYLYTLNNTINKTLDKLLNENLISKTLLTNSIDNLFTEIDKKMIALSTKMEESNPFKILSKGYTKITDFYGNTLDSKSSTTILDNKLINITFFDGSIKARIEYEKDND
jgi:exodeoxyribonuclease VII large subunit